MDDLLGMGTGPRSGRFSPRRLGAGALVVLTVLATLATQTVMAGTSGAATASPPGKPTTVVATAHAGSATVTWKKAPTNGTPITKYTVTSTPTKKSCTWTQATTTGKPLSCTVTGLANGDSYSFTVAATNGQGTGTASAPSNKVTPVSVPGIPTGIKVKAGNASVTVSWQAPPDNGTPITGYRVISKPTAKTCTATTTLHCTVKGLVNGTTYTFRVHAKNGRGTGTTSATSAPVTPASPPTTPPAIVGTSSGNGSITVDWTPVTPAKDGGATITGYVVHAEIGTTVKATTSAGATTTSATVSDLTNGTAYRVTVAAENSAGAGAAATSGEVTPSAVPSKPSNVIAQAADHSVLVIWTAPSANGTPITGYKVTGSTATHKTCTTTTAVTCYVTGLTNGSSYSFTVTATNGRGTSTPSTASLAVVPAAVPDAPAITNVAPADQSVTVKWTGATGNGTAVTGYTVTSSPTGKTCTTNGTLSCTVAGLINGTFYTFRVQATNGVGIGPSSPPSTKVKPSTVPDAPITVTATAGNKQATVSWKTVATGTNGTKVTGYTVTSTPTQRKCTSTSKSCTVPTLHNGTSYTFTVTAKNADGTSLPSAPSNGVVPATAPTAGPSITSLTSTNTALTVEWAKLPATKDGGDPVRYYVVKATGTTLTKSTIDRTVTVATNGTATVSGTISGLAYGVPIKVTVAAKNTVGTGGASTAGSIILKSMPAAPTRVHATVAFEAAEVTWFDPSYELPKPTPVTVNDADHGTPITLYTVTSTTDEFTCTTSQDFCYVRGLTNGVDYSFTVTATNGQGTGPASTATNTVVPATVPTAPTAVSAAAGDASAAVTWNASPTSHGSPVTEYVVTSAVTSETCSAPAPPHCTVTGLTNGVADAFRVRAVNATGKGPRSSSTNVVVPFTVPSAPRTVTAKAVNAADGGGEVTVSWKKPSTNGSAITRYTVVSTPTGRTCTSTSTSTSVSCTVKNLANGTAYRFSVRAVNAAGTSAPATATATPYSTPVNPPTLSTWNSGNRSITVTWAPLNPATDGGKAVTKYLVKAVQGTTTKKTTSVSGSSTSATLKTLVNGTSYVVTVAAENTAGTGPAASTPALTPSTTPGPPTNVLAYAGNQAVQVLWTAATPGGTPVTGYVVTSTTGKFSCGPTTALTCTVSELTNGASYTFTVQATNGRGTGPASTQVKGLVPSTYAGPPLDAHAVAHNGSATVSWTAPTTDGGSPISGYTVTSKPVTGKTTDKTCSTTAAKLTCRVTGLTNGTSYVFRVRATNSTGTGPASAASTPVTPSKLPTAPVTARATASAGKATVTWKAATPNGTTIVGYTATSTPGSDTCTQSTPKKLTQSTISCTVTGLTDGTPYFFKVRARNGAGTGPTSTPTKTVIPVSAPLSGPVISSATTTNQTITVTWQPLTPAEDGGEAVSGYVVQAKLGSTTKRTTTLPGTATTATIKTLVNGTKYTIAVAAKNPEGTGPASTVKTLVPSTVPEMPTNVTATAGNGEALVLWDAAADGGSPITAYTVTSTPPGGTCSTTGALTCDVTGLSNGTTYRFRVVAHNVRGTSAASTPSNTVKPESLPGPPTGVTATANDESATVTWTAPSTTGGYPITGYRVVSTSTTRSCTTTGSAHSCTVSGLKNNKKYTFRVQAENEFGYGTLSAASNPVTPWVAPGEPLNVHATAGNASAKVTWTPPAVIVTPVTSYVVTATHGGKTCSTTGALDCTVTGLTNGTTYTFTVRAGTAEGYGTPSASSNAVTPESGTSPKPPKTPTPSKPSTPSKPASGASQGYWEVASDGGLFSFGTAQFYGSMGGKPLNEPIVGMTAMPTGKGYWEVASDGGLFSFGTAQFYGSMGGKPLNQPIVGMTATPTGKGYWEVASDGGLFAFGNAGFYGSMGGQHLDQPIVGMTATPTGKGYWEVASDGGLFAFGNAGFYGSMGGQHLDQPIVGMTATPTGNGYWEVASDGGLFAFGNAGFDGSMGGKPLDKPIVGMTATATGKGYWEVASDGGLFSFGAAEFEGSMGGKPLDKPIVAMAQVP